MGTRETGHHLFRILDPFYDSKLMELASYEAKKIIKKKNKLTKEKKIIINNFLKVYNQNSSLKYISIAHYNQLKIHIRIPSVISMHRSM